MEFHTFGDNKNKAIVLIHGVLTPWQIWEKQIEYFGMDYYVVVPALDAHIEDSESEFISVDGEAEAIEKYIADNLGGNVYALCGLSMGGVIANRIFERENVTVDKLVLDGAPLVKIPALFKIIMTSQYKSIVHKSKLRDKKTLENFKKYFLPERYIESYLKFVDTMSDSSVKNMIASVCDTQIDISLNSANTSILFLYGTEGNEVYSKRSAEEMQWLYSESFEAVCFEGYKHTELAVYNSNKWCEVVDEFLNEETYGE